MAATVCLRFKLWTNSISLFMDEQTKWNTDAHLSILHSLSITWNEFYWILHQFAFEYAYMHCSSRAHWTLNKQIHAALFLHAIYSDQYWPCVFRMIFSNDCTIVMCSILYINTEHVDELSHLANVVCKIEVWALSHRMYDDSIMFMYCIIL